MDTLYTDGLMRMIEQRIEAAKGDAKEIEFYYQLAAMVMGLAEAFGAEKVEMVLMGACNLDITVEDAQRIHERTGVV